MMMQQKPESNQLSTSDQMENELKSKRIKQTQGFILSRIKYLNGSDWYDILDEKKYRKTLNQLTLKVSGQVCDERLIVEIFNQCPKELRGGVKVQSIAQIVARKINDQTIPKQKRQQLQQTFIGTNLLQAHKPSYRSVISYIFGFFGISAVFNWIYRIMAKPKTSTIEVGTQSIHQAQFSSSGSNLQTDKVCLQSVVHGVRVPGLVDSSKVLEAFHKDSEVLVKDNITTRQAASFVGLQTQIAGSFLGLALKSLGQFLIDQFFIRNPQSKKVQFSMGNTLMSLYHILPVCCMLYLILKGQDSQDSNSSDNKQTIHITDRFFICG